EERGTSRSVPWARIRWGYSMSLLSRCFSLGLCPCLIVLLSAPCQTYGHPPDRQGDPLPVRGQARLDPYGDPLPQGAIVRLGTDRYRGSESTTSVFFSPDGKLLASGSWDMAVRLWDPATGRELRR